MKSFKVLALVPALLLAACTAEVTSGTSGDFSDGRALKVSSDPLSGEVNNSSWKMGRAIARLDIGGEYSVTMAGEGVALTCTNFLPNAPHIGFTVPGTGSYPYASSAGSGQRVVNFIFPYKSADTIGSDNILASKSLIQIDSIQGGVMNGNLSALSPVSTSQSYSIAGRFQAVLCNTPSEMPMFISQKGTTAFRMTYAEAVKINGGYEVRLMDHMPTRKCNAWDSWMMTEVPIKYVSVRVPATVGAVGVAQKTVEYGSQDNSGGWSTDYFSGTVKVVSLSATDIAIALKVKDLAAAGIDIEGAVTTTICTP